MARKGRRKPPADAGEQNDPHGMIALMHRHLDWMRIRDYSERTVENRHFYLTYFIEWCEERGITKPSEVNKTIFDRYQRYLYHYRKRNGEPLSYRSKFSRLVPLRAWFKWLTRENIILYNPASELELPRLEQRLPKNVLSASEAEQIINQTIVTKPIGVRDRAILETFYSTGIRRMEICGLELSDLDTERGTLMIRHGKGSKDRVVPIGDRALAWIAKYLIEVRPTLSIDGESGNALFLTHLGKPFRVNQMTDLVRRYVENADIGKRGACHIFRHTMATLMLENGADIRYIQAMLGHAKLDTTQIYTRISIRKLKEIHDKTHPARLERKPDDEGKDETEEPEKNDDAGNDVPKKNDNE